MDVSVLGKTERSIIKETREDGRDRIQEGRTHLRLLGLR